MSINTTNVYDIYGRDMNQHPYILCGLNCHLFGTNLSVGNKNISMILVSTSELSHTPFPCISEYSVSMLMPVIFLHSAESL